MALYRSQNGEGPMTGANEEFNSLSEAADYARICRQAVFVAIRKGQLKAEKRFVLNRRNRRLFQWIIKRSDLDEYRKNKYSREKRMVEGERLFDLERDRLSVLHAARILSEALRCPYPTHRLYYLLRVGKARGFKRVGAWIIKKEELIRIYKMECGNSEQMELIQ